MGSTTLTKIKIHPTGMRLHEWICLEERFLEQQGLDVEVLWGVVHNKMRAWQDGEQGQQEAPPGHPVSRQGAGHHPTLRLGQHLQCGCGNGKICAGRFRHSPTRDLCPAGVFDHEARRLKRRSYFGRLHGRQSWFTMFRIGWRSIFPWSTSRSPRSVGMAGVSRSCSTRKWRRQACSIPRSAWRRSWV